jgi:hypothetical protein
MVLTDTSHSRVNDYHLDAVGGYANMATEGMSHSPFHIDWSQLNSTGPDSITGAWFSQQLVNLDWLDFPWPPA